MDHYKDMIDLGALGSIVVTVVGLLPTIATALAILWYGVRFYDRFIKKSKSE